MGNEQKVGLSVINWILCIGGILLLASFIILPPVFRAFVKEKEEPPINTEPIQTRCLKTVGTEDIAMDYEYFLDGIGETLNMISYTSTGTYQIVPDETQATCDTNTMNYQNIEGLYYICGIVENKVIIESRVTLPNYQGDNLPFMINFKQNYSAIVSNLTQNGFTCNEVK